MGEGILFLSCSVWLSGYVHRNNELLSFLNFFKNCLQFSLSR